MKTTARALIEGAFGKIGILGAGSVLEGADLAHGMTALNDLCDELRLGPSFAYRHGETVAALPTATGSLTIGPGEAFDTDVPERLEAGCFTRVGGDDWPLEVVDLATYNSARQKTTTGARPSFAYLDPAVPIGRVYFWPLGECEVHLVTRTHVGQFTEPEAEYELPSGYKALLVNTLAERLAPDYEVAVPATVVATARNLRRSLKVANTLVPQLDVCESQGDVRAAFFGGD